MRIAPRNPSVRIAPRNPPVRTPGQVAKKKAKRSTSTAAADQALLIRTFSAAVQAEMRFGARVDSRADLDGLWRRVVELIDERR